MQSDKILFISSIAIFIISFVSMIIVLVEKRNNIKKLRELEEREKEHETKRKILSRISHEIRTPVIGIVGMIKISQQNINDKEKIEECLYKINRSAKYLFALLDDVLDIVRLKNGIVNTKNKEINLRYVIDTCIAMTSERFYDRKIEYIKIIEDVDKYKIKGDELHLTQIFLNLLCNAVKYTKDGGYVIFKANEIIDEKINRKEQVCFQFKISDTGVGISKEFLENIWKEFVQDDKNVVLEKYKGTGLGLSIVKRYIDLAGRSYIS